MARALTRTRGGLLPANPDHQEPAHCDHAHAHNDVQHLDRPVPAAATSRSCAPARLGRPGRSRRPVPRGRSRPRIVPLSQRWPTARGPTGKPSIAWMPISWSPWPVQFIADFRAHRRPPSPGFHKINVAAGTRRETGPKVQTIRVLGSHAGLASVTVTGKRRELQSLITSHEPAPPQ